MKAGILPCLLFFLLLLAGLPANAYGASHSLTHAGTSCELSITNVTTTDETCPGASDGTLTVTATCPSCAGGNIDIRYSIDNSDFSNTTGVFTGLAPGDYTVYVRDVNDVDCVDSNGAHTVVVGLDYEAPVPDVPVTGGDWAEVSKALASDGATVDEFGISVSISGNYAIVGAHQNDDNGSNSGSAYIYERSGDTWTQQVKLTASDAAEGDKFGYSVSISGDYAIVGAYRNNNISGSAYIFHRNGSNWTQQAKLTASDGAADGEFGYSVSISGDYVIVGAIGDDDQGIYSGSAYIFHRSGSIWTEQSKLMASDGVTGDRFGISVSISGEYAIVGAYIDDDNGIDSGSAYIFERSGSTWAQQSKLTASDGASDDWFGWAVSISGDYAIVGAYRNDGNGADSGAAYVFQRNGSTWSQQTKLTAADSGPFHRFGYSVSISSDLVIVGARWGYTLGTKKGSAYIYKRNGKSWAQQSKLTAADGAAHDEFGCSVSISGDYVIVGAYANDDNDDDSGSAYFFRQMPGDLPVITSECSATPPTPTATDNCAGIIVGTTTTSFPITSLGTTTISWTYEDGNGNITTQKQDVVLEDVTDPIAVCPTSAPTVVLDGSGNGILAANALAGGNSTDNCAAAPIETSPMLSFNCVDAPTATVVLTATDAAGNTDTTQCTVNINYSNCPCIFITNIAITDETCPGSNDGTISATALCSTCVSGNSDIRFSIDNLDFSNTTGLFTGLAPGSYTVYVRDVNDNSCTDSDNSQIVWEGVDEPPVPDVSTAGGWTEVAKLLASDGSTQDQFGFSVAISGDYAIVGADQDDDNGNLSGSVYIIHRSGNSWFQQVKLTASDAAVGKKFGSSVSIHGDYAIVGADYDNENGPFSGSAYIFHRSDSTWTEEAKLTASDGAEYDRFGLSVSISGDYAIVGARLGDGNFSDSGSAYIFHRSGSMWTEQAKLTASDGEEGDWFGSSVSISGDYAIVGAHLEGDNDSKYGAVYVFSRSDSIWTQQAKLTASDAEEEDHFGFSVSIHGDYIVIGASSADDNGINSGAAYVFYGNGSTWTQHSKLNASDAAEGDRFGRSVSISDNYVVAGTLFDDDHGSASGSAYIFHRSGNTWTEQSKLTASDADGGDWFGSSVSASDDYVIVGASLNNDIGVNSGSAYIFNGQAPGNLPAFTAECSAMPPTPTATDDCNGIIIGTTPATFPITTPGTTTITWTYDDGNGNITIQEQDIVLEDVTEPVITCPMDIALQASSPAGAVVTFADALATDNCGAVVVTQTEGAASGSTFAAGLHTIVFEATDAASNTASCSFTIEVEPLVSVSQVGSNGLVKLYQNRPNPFEEVTRIGFELPEAAEVKLRIMDVSGREIQLIEGRYAAGYHEVEVRDLPARGLLFYQLQTDSFTATLKMVRE